jgi:hypothetical protein
MVFPKAGSIKNPMARLRPDEDFRKSRKRRPRLFPQTA